MTNDVIVVGSGLFGSVIAAQLRSEGRKVTVIDAAKPDAGSKPAACLMRPSWFSSMGKDKFEPSLALLDRLYGVQDIKFKVGPASATVHWCNPKSILQQADIYGTATTIKPGLNKQFMVGYEPVGSTAVAYASAGLVVVAAGIWSAQLLPIQGLKGQAGMALLFPDQAVNVPYIQPWAPYRQLVAFNRGDGLWVGDGSAIRAENWNAEREQQVMLRCQKATCNVGHPDKGMKKLFGIRPYTDHKPCFLEEITPGLWAATGGAKNGTIAAGWCADQISRRS